VPGILGSLGNFSCELQATGKKATDNRAIARIFVFISNRF